MRLAHLPGDVHLTYCTNIHPGKNWKEDFEALQLNFPIIKKTEKKILVKFWIMAILDTLYISFNLNISFDAH